MGTEAVWIPLVMAAIGTGASVYNTQRTAKKQDSAMAAQIEGQARKGREADKVTRAAIDAQAASNPQDAANKALSQYTQQLQAGQGKAIGTLGGMAGASDRYNEDAAAAALGVQKYGADQAGLQARIDAPLRQRDEEGFSRQRAVTDLGAIERAARMRNFLDGLKTQTAGVRNAGVDAFAGLMKGAAASYGGGAGMGTTTLGSGATGAAGMGGSMFGTSSLYPGGYNS